MTTASQTTRRKGKPYNPAAPVHDRRATDLLRNARVAAVDVDDPYEPGSKLRVLRSVRDDPLAEMRARGQIDDCDYEAGRHWQRAYENAEIGGVCGIDPSREAVDGGRMREVLTDRQIRATKELAAARKELGGLGNWLIVSVLGTRKTLEEVARFSAGNHGYETEYKYLRGRFKRALETLAVLFGYAHPIRA